MKSLTNLLKFMNDPVSFLDERFKSNSAGIQTLRLGPKRFHLIFSPELAHEVLVLKANVFIQNRSIFDRIKPITGEKGLVQLNGQESRETRSKIRPMLMPSNLEEMNKLIIQNTMEAMAEIKSGEQLDMTSFMADLVLRNAFGMFLGIDIKDDASDIVMEYRELNELCGKRMVSLMPVPLLIPTRTNLRIKKLRKSLRTKIQQALKDKNPSTTNIHKIFLDDPTLVDQCMTFLFAGHETTASSLAFTFLLLGSHPESKMDEPLHVYKEALRLFPPAYMLAREVAKDSELGGVKVKKGDQILIGVKQIHRHPDYHSSPDAFIPARFQNEARAFLPFGQGAKNCIGEKLAYMEAVSIIKCFHEKFHLKTLNPNIECYPLVTLHPRSHQYIEVRHV